MAVTLTPIAAGDIEAESFRIIESEFNYSKRAELNEAEFRIIQRVIHATGDFAFADNMRFAPGAVDTGIKKLQAGKKILTDVTMAAAGISKPAVHKWGGEVICGVADPEVAARAKERAETRSETAISLLLDESIGIVAVGNAPTALVRAVRIVNERFASDPPLIVGVPVGFVNAPESKDLLVEENSCYITALGRKGGSPVAAAIINALLRLSDS